MQRNESLLLKAIRAYGHSATIAELMTATGLSRHEIEAEIPKLVKDRRGHLQVTESGEIRYYFPYGLSSQTRGALARLRQTFRVLLEGLGWVFRLLFKIWIVVMLVGYFLVFVTLLVLLVSLLVVAQVSVRSDSRSSRQRVEGNLWAFKLVSGVLNFALRLWFYNQLLSEPQKHIARRPSRPTQPFHESVFQFVFGVENPFPAWLRRAREALVHFTRKNKGVVSLDEIQVFTGADRPSANGLFSDLLLNYRGEVRVSDEGTLYGWFEEILRAVREGGEEELEPAPLWPLHRLPPGVLPWIVLFNVFNLAFGGLFLAYTLFDLSDSLLALLPLFTEALIQPYFGPQLAVDILRYGLGLVPLAFSVLFFLIPLVRWLYLNSYNRAIETCNRRRAFLRSILANPMAMALAPEDEPEKLRWLLDFLDGRKLEVVQTGSTPVYACPDLKREMIDLEEIRRSIDPSRYEMGQTIFDSNR